MSYRFKQQESLSENIKRIVHEQIHLALYETGNDQLDPDETIHQIRKRCKKIRALLRLARQDLEADNTYRYENQRFRDAARPFSRARDAAALIETCDELMNAYRGEIDPESFAPVRRQLVLQHEEHNVAGEQTRRRLDQFQDDLNLALKQVDDWPLTTGGFDALEPGLRKTYRRGQKALGNAYEQSSDESFHEWRKRVKYHYYHVRMLRNIWKPVLKSLTLELETLSDYLGDDHNLAVLHQNLQDNPGRFGSSNELKPFLELIHHRREALRHAAWVLGQRIYAGKPKTLTHNFDRYWQVWKAQWRGPACS